MGAELFTGNAMIMSLGLLGGKVSWKGLAINWGLSYLGNYIGTLIMALIMWGTGAYATGPTLTYIQNLAFNKTYDDWGVLILKGIPCNVLVCSGPIPLSYDSVSSQPLLWTKFPLT